MQIGFVGLGRMGFSLAQNMHAHGHRVLCWNRSEQRRGKAAQAGLKVYPHLPLMIGDLDGPKVIWLMLSAGPGIDEILFGDHGIVDLLSAGDIVVDGANSHFTDTKRRAAALAEKQVLFLDCGISGGPKGARNGACVMVGGDREAYESIEPLLKDICVEDGYGYFGTHGAGHYLKMVHNAVEYGMMQAIAEGMSLLASSEYQPILRQVADVWNHGSIVAGKLMDATHETLKRDADLSDTPAEVGALGTGQWATEEALRLGIPFASIANAVFTRFESQGKDTQIHQQLQALRAEFGGHRDV